MAKRDQDDPEAPGIEEPVRSSPQQRFAEKFPIRKKNDESIRQFLEKITDAVWRQEGESLSNLSQPIIGVSLTSGQQDHGSSKRRKEEDAEDRDVAIDRFGSVERNGDNQTQPENDVEDDG